MEFQRLPRSTTGGNKLILEQFYHDGNAYLLFDTEDRGHSTLYRFIEGSFEPVQYLDTLDGNPDVVHTQWKYFTV